MVLFEYCEETTFLQREDIVKVIMDNETLTQNIILMSSLKEDQPIDFEQAFDDFNKGLIKFIDKGKLSPEMGIFFVLHFRNFEDIKRSELYDEFSKEEYDILISQYLQRQTNFKLVWYSVVWLEIGAGRFIYSYKIVRIEFYMNICLYEYIFI